MGLVRRVMGFDPRLIGSRESFERNGLLPPPHFAPYCHTVNLEVSRQELAGLTKFLHPQGSSRSPYPPGIQINRILLSRPEPILSTLTTQLWNLVTATPDNPRSMVGSKIIPGPESKPRCRGVGQPTTLRSLN